MNNIDFLYLNTLSSLHDNKEIFFCKTDYLLQDFKTISEVDNKAILITGNSDYPITDEIVNMAPKNIVRWYAQNAVSNASILYPTPIGLENKIVSYRNGHGIDYYNRAKEKEKLIEQYSINLNVNKLIYANFNINTNYEHRFIVKKYCEESSFIDWEEPILPLSTLYKNVSEYKMVVCPAGNGIDTHRIWEMLYLKKIPITIKLGNYKIYKLYEQLPIILLNNIYELLNYQLIIKLYQECINKNWNKLLLNNTYWLNQIQNYFKIQESI